MLFMVALKVFLSKKNRITTRKCYFSFNRRQSRETQERNCVKSSGKGLLNKIGGIENSDDFIKLAAKKILII